MSEYILYVYLLSAISSVTFGVVGAFVVARRIGYLSGAISHCAFGGAGIGLWFQNIVQSGSLGVLALVGYFTSGKGGIETCENLAAYFDPSISALLFSVLAALLVDWIRRHAKEREETLLGAVWAVGMSIGLFFLQAIPKNASPSAFLFGDILLVGKRDFIIAAILSVGILGAVFCNFKKLEAVCFDEEYALLRGINVGRQNRLLLALTAITIVLMLRIVGMAMIVALLTLPAATACRFTKRLSSMIIFAIGICLFGSWTGVTISILTNASTGPTIVMVVATLYALSLASSVLIAKMK